MDVDFNVNVSHINAIREITPSYYTVISRVVNAPETIGPDPNLIDDTIRFVRGDINPKGFKTFQKRSRY